MALKVLPPLPTLIVLSHIPGREAVCIYTHTDKLYIQRGYIGGQTDSCVFGARVGQPLIHFICETDDIISLAQLGHHLQLLPCVHLHQWAQCYNVKESLLDSNLSKRIVGVVDNNHLSLGGEGSFQFSRVQHPVLGVTWVLPLLIHQSGREGERWEGKGWSRRRIGGERERHTQRGMCMFDFILNL